MLRGLLWIVLTLVGLGIAGCAPASPVVVTVLPEPSPTPRLTRTQAPTAPPLPPEATAPPAPTASPQPAHTPTTAPQPTASPAPVVRLRLTILYDNNRHAVGVETAWGFACLVEGLEQTILFDTGGDGPLLLRNMRRLGHAPAEVDAVVLSHAHGDHTGGLRAFLAENPTVTVYLPQSFPPGVKQTVIEAGADLVEVSSPVEIVQGAMLTGELGSGIREQALVLSAPAGLVVLTGCAHPGIVTMVSAAKEVAGQAPDLVLGGFHLGSASAAEIDRIADDLRALGVRRVAPCHCSGDLARARFAAAFGPDALLVGVGARLTLDADEDGPLDPGRTPRSR